MTLGIVAALHEEIADLLAEIDGARDSLAASKAGSSQRA